MKLRNGVSARMRCKYCKMNQEVGYFEVMQYDDGQWVRGKSCDSFAPCGPFVVTVDEVGDPHNLKIECKRNDSIQQSSNTSQLIFNSYQLIEFIELVCNLAAIKLDGGFLVDGIEAFDSTYVTVENILVVVIDCLHDLVTNAECPAIPLDRLTFRIETLLQSCVQIATAQESTLHWRKHLDVTEAVKTEAIWDCLAGQVYDQRDSLFRLLCMDEVEVSTGFDNTDAQNFYTEMGFHDRSLLLSMELNTR